MYQSRITRFALALIAFSTLFVAGAQAKSSRPKAPAKPAVGTAGTVVTVTANYTASPTNRIILCDASSNSITVTLPPADAAGQEVTVIVIALSPLNTVTVWPAEPDLIRDVRGYSSMGNTGSRGETTTYLSDGNGNWYVTGANNYTQPVAQPMPPASPRSNAPSSK